MPRQETPKSQHAISPLNDDNSAHVGVALEVGRHFRPQHVLRELAARVNRVSDTRKGVRQVGTTELLSDEIVCGERRRRRSAQRGRGLRNR